MHLILEFIKFTSANAERHSTMPFGIVYSFLCLVFSVLFVLYCTDFASYLVQHALEQLKELLGESSPFQGRLPNSISFKDLQQKLEEVQTVAQLCEEVLGIEGAVSLLGSGPRGDHYTQP